MTERSAGLPSQTQVIELLDGEFARAGYEIEDVVIDAAARPPRITVIADGDTALDLDTIAALSRSASELLDARRRHGGDVRPRNHFTRRRPPADHREALPARARPQGGTDAVRRIADDRPSRRNPRRRCALVVREGRGADWAVRELPLGQIVKAVVQVEFSPPIQRELELAGQSWEGGSSSEHRHGRTARDRGRQGHLGRRGARDDQVRAAHAPTGTPRATRPTRVSRSTARPVWSR